MAITHDTLLFTAKSLAASFTSNAWRNYKGRANFHIYSVTATDAAGTLKIQGSNDNSHWVDISGLTATISAGALFNKAFESETSFKFLRVSWTQSAGSGATAECIISL